MGRHDPSVTLGSVLQLPPLPRAPVISPLAARIGRCGAQMQLAPVAIVGRVLPQVAFGVPYPRRQDDVVGAEVDGFLGTQPGVDRFDLLLRAPLVQRPFGPNVYLYRVHLYLTYNIHTKPLDVGEVLVNFPYVPGPGEYYWDSYYSTHPQVLSGVLSPAQIPIYKKCAIKNSHALHSILSLPARRVAQLASILPRLRY
jgi:hypothetical protein